MTLHRARPCPICGKPVALLKDGTIRWHRDTRPKPGGGPDNPACAGISRLPDEQPRKALMNPTIEVIWGGEPKQLPARGHVCDLAAAACDAFNLTAATRERVALFNGNGVELDEDAPLRDLIEPLVLRDRIVRA